MPPAADVVSTTGEAPEHIDRFGDARNLHLATAA